MEGNHPETNNVTTVITKSDLPRLFNVEYPATVENPVSAIRTMGGIKRVSEVFAHYPNKKLELKYRPGDLFCNPVVGNGRITTGLLLSVRRKKTRDGQYDPTSTTVRVIPPHQQNTKSDLIDLDDLDQENYDQKFLSLMDIQPADILPEDITINDELIPEMNDSQSIKNVNMFKRKILKEEAEILQTQLEESLRNPELEKLPANENNMKKYQQSKIEVPRGNIHAPQNKNIEVKALGVVNKLFSFDGVSNFQYLPMIQDESKGEYKSIANDIFPRFGDPERGDLYEALKMENGERKSFLFCPPLFLSKIDMPVKKAFNYNQPVPENINDTLLVIEEDVISSKREKRSVYTTAVSFKENDKVIIPMKPQNEALEVATRKFLTGEKLNPVKTLFENRPVWSKIALEYETKFTAEEFKYILPCIAYFAVNGPWRNLWIKFGYDPRKDKGAFIYQLIDYRPPHLYRCHLTMHQNDEESYHKFKPDTMPPKSQMFYQLCDILVPEIQELAISLSVLMDDPSKMVYSSIYGFLDANIIEFCRYSMSRCIEVYLHSLGKITNITIPEISLQPGGSIPVEQLHVQPRRKRTKRVRTATTSKRKAKVVLPKKTPLTVQNVADLFDDDEEEEENEDDKCQEQNNDVSIRELVRRALNENAGEEVLTRRPSRMKSILEPSSESSRDTFSDEQDPLYIPDEFFDSSD